MKTQNSKQRRQELIEQYMLSRRTMMGANGFCFNSWFRNFSER